MEYEINESCSTAPSIPASYLTGPRFSPLPRSHPNRLSCHPQRCWESTFRM